MWPLDLALLLLCLLVLMLVLRALRFDDPRVFYNAWTYFLGVPTILIASSMIARSLASGAVERSIQIGFLLSVAVHLGFLFAASRVVPLASLWIDSKSTEEYVELQNATRGAKFAEILNANGPARPVYMKPVEADIQKPTEVEIQPAQVQEHAKLEPTQALTEYEPELADRDFINERKEISPSLPSVTSEAAQINRPDLQAFQQPASGSIEVPETKLDSLPSGEPTNMRDVSHVRRTESETASSVGMSNLPDPTLASGIAKPSLEPTANRNSASVADPTQQLNEALAKTANVSAPNPAIGFGGSNKIEKKPPSNAVVPIPELTGDSAAPKDEVALDRVSGTRSERDRTGRSPIESSIAFSPDAGPGAPNVSSNPNASIKVPSRAQNGFRGAADIPSESRYADSRTPTRSGLKLGGSVGGRNRQIEIPSAGDAGSNDGTGNSGTVSTELDSTTIGKLDIRRDGNSGISGEGIGMLRSSGGLESGTEIGSLSGLAGKGPGLGELRAAVPADVRLPDLRKTDLTTDRFKRPELGGPGRVKGAVPIPTPAFKQRIRRNQDPSGQDSEMLGALGPKTEDAIELGLEFLAKHQREDGSWHLEDFGEPVQIRSNSAATALALLSFQGAGYTHEQFKHQETCRKGLQWLLSVQSPKGDLYQPMDKASDSNAWLYSHAIATLAVCEAYGMTQDASIKDKAQLAVDFLVSSQDKNGGGWRYEPGRGSDTSVTGWCMMALKSAELAGLKVPNSTYELIRQWLDNSQASAREKFLYRYNWQANSPQTRHGTVPTPVMTSVGLLMRLYLGWKRDNPDMMRGTDWLLQRPPAEGTETAPMRDTYYWYYASQVMFHMGGDRWKQWYGTLYPILIDTQISSGEFAGSWEPNGKIPDAWGKFAGRLYVTTLNLLSLEVYYRHLPIYEATAR